MQKPLALRGGLGVTQGAFLAPGSLPFPFFGALLPVPLAVCRVP